MLFPIVYFILFLWSIVSLLYALIKRHEIAIEAFIILAPNLWIMVNNTLNSYHFYTYFI